MMRIKSFYLFKFLLCLLLAVCFVFSLGIPAAHAMAKDTRTVRVAFPIQTGLTQLDEHGNYSGYTYEYLEEIAQYTGWNYEFIEVPGDPNESLLTLMDMLEKGEVDLMGGMLYSEELGQQYDYASYSYGSVETTLQVLYESPQDITINSQVSQTFRIAVAGKGGQRQQELEEYCKMNLITPVYIYCDGVEEQLAALKSGAADMMLNVSMNYVDGVRTVARFAPKPFYLVTTKGNDSGLVEELNSAILSVEQANPSFSSELYEKYFFPPSDTLYLSDSEAAYVSETGKLRVGVLTGQSPYQYEDENGKLTGISIGLLDYISQQTGLEFELIPFVSRDEMYASTQKGGLDIVAGIPYDYDFAREHGVSLAQPYVSSQYLLMIDKDVSENSIEGKRLASLSTENYKGESAGSVVVCDSALACIQAVARGEADYTYVDAYTAQYYTNLPQYRNFKLIPQAYEPRKICFGVVKPGSWDLLSILNKVNSTISETDMQSIINQNITQKPPASLGDFLFEYPVESVAVIVCISIAIIAILLIFLRQRAKMNKKNALELKKHFQVYALMNEYFFEYNFKTGIMIVSTPSKSEDGQPSLLDFDFRRPSEEKEKLRKPFMDVILSQEDGIHEVQLACIDGKTHWLRIALETVYDNSSPAYAIGKINIIDEEKLEKDTLLKKSQHDSLTHIYNAETSFELISEALSGIAPGEMGALLIADIDHFKLINDTYGHLRGDEVLRQVASLLKSSFRKEDIVGRPGGDEFIVYMRNIRDVRTLTDKCASLCEQVHGILIYPGKHLTVSIGVAIATEGTTYSKLYQLADHALYKAKELGRDTFHLADGSE
ncbi:transporter substrate-binding domain-containing diguanylate cyclase [Christensenella tenuis]|uniref:Transporter substrate-binding domain-containing protein n=1 Tax=Christensenella tenuis TaxID=2763033 RepID=A0ABR7EGY5_9FIRM|nr:transporter substrate-binding domain-containing protein [Christensenella tenuis]MBC5649040.1 transporter substrate-binding domain-containing protein [Christensenella tenuis]